MELLNVTAIIVTKGDVDLDPVLDSLPDEWEKIEWNNGAAAVYAHPPPNWYRNASDLSVCGRYAAIEYASHDLIFVVDDDVIVSDPQAIVNAWQPGHVVCNMPQEFRSHYPDSALVGFGSCFERDLPAQAFARYEQTVPTLGLSNYGWSLPPNERFLKCCDVVFTTLTPRILVDVPKTDREFASDPNRMWKQPGHVQERTRMLELARQVRDAT